MRLLGLSAGSERETINQLLFLILFAGILFFLNLDNRDLVSSHEARAAQNGQMIVSDGYWGLPRLFDGHLELQKPPMVYWLVALLATAFGGQVDAWAVRLPAALSALGCVLFVYYLGRRLQRPRAGFLAALILASFVHFTWLARIGRIDMPLTFAVTLGCGGFYLGMNAPRAWPWYLLGYVSVAVGILLKGPIALVFVGGIVGAYACLGRRPKSVFTSLWWGLPLVALIAAPWFVWANRQTGNQVWEVFFWYHNLERGLGGSETLASHPFWFYLPRALVDLLPWSIVAAAGRLVFLQACRLAWRFRGAFRRGLVSRRVWHPLVHEFQTGRLFVARLSGRGAVFGLYAGPCSLAALATPRPGSRPGMLRPRLGHLQSLGGAGPGGR